jgi:glycosyltransferase involved in cell wall biosynthesis
MLHDQHALEALPTDIRCQSPRMAPKISVIIPVYNSALTLRPLVHQLREVLGELGAEYEIILVNDDSRDTSWPVIRDLTMEHPHTRGLDLMRNYGQHNALLAGIRVAKHDVVVTLDDDLQNPPDEIPRLLSMLDEGYDVVYGTPWEAQHGLWRDLASWLTKLALQGAMGAETARKVSAFRVFRTQIRDAFASYQGPFVSIDVLLTWGTSRFGALAVRQDPRQAGVSNYTLRKLVIHALNMMTGFTTLPLQLASLTGFAASFFGFILLAYVLARFILEGGSVPGFPLLASTLAIFSGAQLFALGIIGEYLARMHFRLMDKPSYTTRHEIARGCD